MGTDQQGRAKSLVYKYVKERLEKTDEHVAFYGRCLPVPSTTCAASSGRL